MKLGTTLVTAPVIASDRNGLYIPDMRKEEFTVFEDEVKQDLVFFATIEEPFHVVLMLDTSASQGKLGLIQRPHRFRRATQSAIDESNLVDEKSAI